jgi:iron complex transport system substrate-binding protein
VVTRSLTVLLFLLLPLTARATITLAGADGKMLTLKTPASRVVSLAPDLTELTYAAGAGPVLVGASAYSDYPAAAKQLPRIGDAFRFDIERVLALKPELVLAWEGGTPVPVIERLRALHLPVLVIGTHELTDIAHNLELIGQATGHVDQAQRAAGDFLAGLKRLRNQYANRKPVRVFYEISATPLYTVGGSQVISRIIALCGGRNIFDDLTSLAASISLESVLARDPQAIVTGGDDQAVARLRAWRQWPHLSAAESRSLFSINGDLLDRTTPRILEGGKQLCEDLDSTRQRLSNTGKSKS